MANGDVTLGVAGIDLIYLRLSALLCAADRVLPRDASRDRGAAAAPPARKPRLLKNRAVKKTGATARRRGREPRASRKRSPPRR